MVQEKPSRCIEIKLIPVHVETGPSVPISFFE